MRHTYTIVYYTTLSMTFRERLYAKHTQRYNGPRGPSGHLLLCSSSTTLRLLLLAGTYFSEIGVKVSKR